MPWGRVVGALFWTAAWAVGIGACADPPAPVAVAGGRAGTPESSRVVFREATVDWGIDVRSRLIRTGDYPIAESMGHGLAIFDADGDGVLDIYVASAGPREGDAAPDVLLRGKRDGGFEDVTAEAGLGHPGWSTGVAAGDIDNDGDLDLYVGCWGADRLYRNDDGVFTDVTVSAGVDSKGFTTSVVFVDVDVDGFLDLYVVRYVTPDETRCAGDDGEGDYCAPAAYRPELDSLFRNRGDGTFEDVSVESGVAAKAASGLGVAAADLTGDGRVDVYVANDQMPNYLWVHQDDGTLHDQALLLGAALSGRGTAEASMGVDIADVDGDGRLDLFVTHLGGETSTLYLGQPRSGFRDASTTSGIGMPSRPLTAFGTAFADLDLDGAIDLVVGNGRVIRGDVHPSVRGSDAFAAYAEPNQILRNSGNGRFTDVSSDQDSFCATVESTRGMAVADLDRDGDVDVVITSMGGPMRVYENVGPRHGSWLHVMPRDPALRRSTPGVTVTVRAAGRTVSQPSGGGWSYLSHSAGGAHFGLGDTDSFDAIAITWPDGTTEEFPGGAANRPVVVERGEGSRR